METASLINIKDMVLRSTEETIGNVVQFWPLVFGAIGVLIIGWIVSYLLFLFVVKSSDKLRLGFLSDKIGLAQFLKDMGAKSSAAEIIARFLRGYVFFMFFIGAAKIVRLNQIADFLDAIIRYIPHVVVALFIVLIGIQISNTVALFVKGALRFTEKHTAEIIANFARFALIFFSILAALVRLKIAEQLVEILFLGFVSMLALAGGLAIGLGGKDIVHKVLQDMVKKTSRRSSARKKGK